MEHIADVEDAVQAALMSSLETWQLNGLPSNPSAWLFRVATNKLNGQLRNISGSYGGRGESCGWIDHAVSTTCSPLPLGEIG